MVVKELGTSPHMHRIATFQTCINVPTRKNTCSHVSEGRLARERAAPAVPRLCICFDLSSQQASRRVALAGSLNMRGANDAMERGFVMFQNHHEPQRVHCANIALVLMHAWCT